ncbi:hypothetical protein TWF694_009043 [Orbilia ellipsospora]|uniref:Zn(2)-C6 fungal-type domain-containing protein n=1 Tax=Orbilia ellipsospora TaxID=2528407 RepID=A0AAV9XDS8_9PEZI
MNPETVLSLADGSVGSPLANDDMEISHGDSASECSDLSMGSATFPTDDFVVEDSVNAADSGDSDDAVGSVDLQNDVETVLHANRIGLGTAVESPKLSSKKASLGDPETSACFPDVDSINSSSNYPSSTTSHLSPPSSNLRTFSPIRSTTPYDPKDPEYIARWYKDCSKHRREVIATWSSPNKKGIEKYKVTSAEAESSVKTLAMANENPSGPARRGRKRKVIPSPAPLDLLANNSDEPKLKRTKVGDGRKPPACKRCYQKHIACGRSTEDEPCETCFTRGINCEPNIIKPAKGRRAVKEEPTSMDIEGDETEGMIDKAKIADNPIFDNLLLYFLSFIFLFVEETLNDLGTPDSTQAVVDNRAIAEAATTTVSKEAVGGDEGSECSSVREEAEEDGAGMEVETELAELTEQEREVVGILSALKDSKVELLDLQTSLAYFKAIEEALARSCGDGEGIDDVRHKLDQLKCQYIWMNNFQGS